jgi:hypothetical protein
MLSLVRAITPGAVPPHTIHKGDQRNRVDYRGVSRVAFDAFYDADYSVTTQIPYKLKTIFGS